MPVSAILKKVPGTQRVIPAEETIERVYTAARALGVTRLADITGLDRIGLPTFSAIVPRSKDGLSVSTGKGLRPADAKAGALMEAIERQTAISSRLPLVQGTFGELQRHSAILDPRDTKELLLDDYDTSRKYFWVRGVDLVSESSILVPAHMAGLVWDDVPRGPFRYHFTSNGLSSGNVREEAICQGLCELIERDAWTLADLGAHLIPWARRHMLNPETADRGPDDFELFPSIDSIDCSAMQQFQAAGLSPILHDITSDIGIPTIFAAVPDDDLPGFPMVHGGVGTHPDVRVAVTRALTEAAQSRCVDIQGVREDLMPPGFESTTLSIHTRRVAGINRNVWFLSESEEPRSLSRIPSASFEDLRSELDYIIARLLFRKTSRIIVVDLTPPNAPFAVVRVIVPDLESASVTRGRLGYRAMQFWRKHAQAGHLPGPQP